MAQIITYGEGGYDPELPDDNIVEIIELPDPPVDEVQVAKDSAMAKLSKLGLTEEEIAALLG